MPGVVLRRIARALRRLLHFAVAPCSRPWLPDRRRWGLGLCLALAGPFGMAAPPAPASAPALTLAIADLPAFSSALVAEAEGLFSAEGLELRFVHCVNGKQCLQFLREGRAQLATAADAPIALASLTGPPFEVLATLCRATRERYVVARRDHGIQVPHDLEGKRVGVLIGTSAHYLIDTLLLFYGVAPSHVQLVPLRADDVMGPLLRGEIDALSAFNPLVTHAQTALGAHAVLLPTPGIGISTVNLVSVGERGGVTPAQAVQVLRALQAANQRINRMDGHALAMVAARLQLTPAQLRGMWAHQDFELSLSQILITNLEAQARWALRRQLVPGGQIPDYLDYINLGPLQAVAPQAVSLLK